MRSNQWRGLLPHGVASGLPSLCAVCRGWGRQRVCVACVDRFAIGVERCRRCGLEVPAGIETCGACIVAPPPYRGTVAAVTYGYPWDRLVAAFKFHDALDLAPALAGLMLTAHRARADHVPSLLLPVPLSAQRLQERGYNQAWELARRLGPALDCATDANLLVRVRDTPHQLAFPPDRRAANVRSAFAVNPRGAAELRGQAVTVVDDVMTTGATGAEVARVLLNAGAATVDLWIVARTPRPDAARNV